MQRRQLLKGAGTAGAMFAAGGASVIALSGGAKAADTSLEATSPSAVTTDDGEIKYVAFGGRLRFEWDGLDTEAQYGFYKTETRVDTGGGFSGWRSHGKDSGELGDGSGGSYDQGDTGGWGGSNDSNSGPGTDGFFQFKYGDENNNQDYAIAGSGSNLRDANNKYDTSVFESDTDGGTQETVVQFRMTCRVYDGEPGTSGTSMLIEASDTATFTVKVNNRSATATTGGEINGEVGADES